MTAEATSPETTAGEQSDIPALHYFSDTTEGSTFESPKLRQWTESFLADADQILNPCAGTAHLDVDGDVIRVDMDENADADLHIDFRNLPEYLDTESVDAIVYDPPYSHHQAVSKYGVDLEDDGFYYYDQSVMELFDRLLKPGGIYIQFGYTTAGMPSDYGYEVAGVSLYNKLGQQNDYLGVALRKPKNDPATRGHQTFRNTVQPNSGASEIAGRDVSTSGNDGHPIEMQYQRCSTDISYATAVSETVTNWVSDSDRVLHIYESEPTVRIQADDVTRCAYRCIDVDAAGEPVEADVVETPWNIDTRFATGVFDTIVLDLPYQAFQQNLRTPTEEASDGGDKTHVATAIKRAVTDLVRGDGGRVLQIGRTATLMSGIDYDYQRIGVSIIQHPTNDTDRIVVVDEKPHENLETIGLPDGEVDAFGTHHIVTGRETTTGTTTKHSRTEVEADPSSHFCVHCGNHFYHDPALYVTCFECGANPDNYCISESGEVLTDTIHDVRHATAVERHDGTCNTKTPSYVSADEQRVEQAVKAVKAAPKSSDCVSSIQQLLPDRFIESPKSTDLVEQVENRLNDSTNTTTAENKCDTPSTSGTALSDFT
jgi:predicted  nucleic acid-binding Zn-ribbon protein